LAHNPTFQRFISEDPMGFGTGDYNLYRYALDSPTNFRDPSGRCPMCIAGVLGGVIGGAAAGYLAYANGGNGWDVAAAAAGGAGAGILAGLTGGLAGGFAVELGATALAWIIHDFAGGKRKGALKD
jgi:hypothetical protein